MSVDAISKNVKLTGSSTINSSIISIISKDLMIDPTSKLNA